MSFETIHRNMAVSPQDVEALFSALLGRFGEELPDGNERIRTIGGHWDDTAHTRVRAASMHKPTITGILLTDGRVCFRCLWQSDLAATYDAGEVPGVEQLSDEQLAALIVKEEL